MAGLELLIRNQNKTDIEIFYTNHHKILQGKLNSVHSIQHNFKNDDLFLDPYS